MIEQAKDRPVTVGYLKQLFERLNLPDDAVMMYDGHYGWVTVGPEGHELAFLTDEQFQFACKRGKQLGIDFPIKYRRSGAAFDDAVFQIKKATGQ